jgi:Ca2+-transporting ATPase
MILTLISSVVGQNTLPGIAMDTTMYLWVNMTIDTLGPLAFSTQRPDPTILDRPQDRGKASPLITPASWRMIFGQGLWQVLIIIVVSLVSRAFQTSELLTGTVVFTSYICGIFFNLLRYAGECVRAWNLAND